MQKIFSKFLFVMMINLALFSSMCFAQEFTFVDAENTTGYYVDKTTIKIESPEFITTTIAVVRADMNKMYVYNLRINHKNQTYQIMSSKTFEYDTRDLLESNDKSRPYRPYAPKSEMSELIKFILYGEDLTENQK